MIALIIGAAILTLAILRFIRHRCVPISQADLNRRLADLRDVDNDETSDQRIKREESLSMILASDIPEAAIGRRAAQPLDSRAWKIDESPPSLCSRYASPEGAANIVPVAARLSRYLIHQSENLVMPGNLNGRSAWIWRLNTRRPPSRNRRCTRNQRVYIALLSLTLAVFLTLVQVAKEPAEGSGARPSNWPTGKMTSSATPAISTKMMSTKISFASNTTYLSPSGAKAVRQLAVQVNGISSKDHPLKIRIIGYAADPIHSSQQSRRDLALERANTVANALKEAGVTARLIVRVETTPGTAISFDTLDQGIATTLRRVEIEYELPIDRIREQSGITKKRISLTISALFDNKSTSARIATITAHASHPRRE